MPPISGGSRTCRGTTCLPVIREDNYGQGRGRGAVGACAFGRAFPAARPVGGHGRGLCRVGGFGGVAGRARGGGARPLWIAGWTRSEEHTSELQSLMRISYAVFCLKKKK